MDGGVLSIRLTIIEGFAESCRKSIAQTAMLEHHVQNPGVVSLADPDRNQRIQQQYEMSKAAQQANLQNLLQQCADLLGQFQPKEPEKVGLKLSE